MSITAVTPHTGPSEEQVAARRRIAELPLEQLDPGDPEGFHNQEMLWKFERLRREDPVHFTPAEHTTLGHYWSLTRWEDIMAADADHESFSAETQIVLADPADVSALELNRDARAADGTVELEERPEDREAPPPEQAFRSLLSMDPPDHELHRGSVQDGVSPKTLKDLEPIIRERAGAILDGLPIGEEFDWVDLVSKELTAMTLATLFDFPQEDRRKLTHWSDVTMAIPGPDSLVKTQDEKTVVMTEFLTAFVGLFQERLSREGGTDFISLMAHSPHAQDFSMGELFGDGVVLLVGGNDTTRNTISGSVYALNKWPEQFAKLRANPALVPSMVSETIRWQTPLTHMTRVATRDVEIGGKVIPKGDRVVLWYVSGNRDEAKVENPDDYLIDRKNPRQHMSFGFGIHRCLGNRLAELQLKIIWEEMLARFPEIVVVEEPKLTFSNFARGYEEMTVVIPRRN